MKKTEKGIILSLLIPILIIIAAFFLLEQFYYENPLVEIHIASNAVKNIDKAKEAGALVIPAHIDEFNGLGYCAGKVSFEAFLKLSFIHAAQFVHKELIANDLVICVESQLCYIAVCHFKIARSLCQCSVHCSDL